MTSIVVALLLPLFFLTASHVSHKLSGHQVIIILHCMSGILSHHANWDVCAYIYDIDVQLHPRNLFIFAFIKAVPL